MESESGEFVESPQTKFVNHPTPQQFFSLIYICNEKCKRGTIRTSKKI